MKRPEDHDTSRDDYLADAPYAHATPPAKATEEGVSPQNPETMPRGEDDEETMRGSREFHDRPGAPVAPKRS